jgi:hypothetical protein
MIPQMGFGGGKDARLVYGPRCSNTMRYLVRVSAILLANEACFFVHQNLQVYDLQRC